MCVDSIQVHTLHSAAAVVFELKLNQRSMHWGFEFEFGRDGVSAACFVVS